MRIAYICMDPGIPVFGTKGASVHVQEVIREMRALGHEVVLYAARLGDHRPDDLADLAVEHIPVRAQDPARREQAQAQAAQRAAELVIGRGVDLVYERYSLFSAALCGIVEELGIPGVLEVNSPLIEEQREHRSLVDESLARRVLRAQVAGAASVVCVSDPVARWVRSAVVDGGHDPQGDLAPGAAATSAPRHVRTVPNGVSVRRIQPQPEAADGPEGVVVTFVGTLKPWHGVADLLEAAAASQGGWSLRILGDGPQMDSLRARAAELGVEVDFRGAIPPQDMPAHLAGSAIGVAPYPDLGGEEQQYFSPLKVLEYLAAGLPVVASAVGQVPLLLEGVGVLVPPSDPVSLARELDALAADPQRRAELGRRGRRRAEERHSWGSVVATILAAVEAR
ncbi:glycosyltransferase family 4 protein [Actinomyces bowdenii]|uniref:Glycosyltransferase family 4 protein n=1 Tax=Actinomyces bowdenii TaxID=131109 RepID=A0A853EIR4_9ACTO|nr:glycosyltransferase family 4 protein [Actinomyces bowdenii]MBF0695919.1 glycosyltransferase family 4 protein [Actinomyces bowdenii]NYS68092.1 glycosyltransferase family 4 protein [Actinomyces bowdenii]